MKDRAFAATVPGVVTFGGRMSWETSEGRVRGTRGMSVDVDVAAYQMLEKSAGMGGEIPNPQI